jgi:hypothetical protein
MPIGSFGNCLLNTSVNNREVLGSGVFFVVHAEVIKSGH